MWGKSSHLSPSLSVDRLSCAFLKGGFQEMEQLVPLAAACLPLVAALALILHFWPPCPRGPQCGNVIQQMSSGSGLQSAFGKGVGREESCPSLGVGALEIQNVWWFLGWALVGQTGVGHSTCVHFWLLTLTSCFSLLSLSFSCVERGW